MAQAEAVRSTAEKFVSLLPNGVMPIEQISRLLDHSGTPVTELVYRSHSEISQAPSAPLWTGPDLRAA